MEIDWDGTRAAIGAGLYANDRPGTCNADEVNAAGLSAEPTERNLQELVRCAALVVESEGYFAKSRIERDPRWGDGSTNVFVMDMAGNQLISSSPLRVNGNALHEWGGSVETGPRPSVAATWFRSPTLSASRTSTIGSFNPVTGRQQSKVGMLKRVVAQGVPVLVGSAYYVPARPIAGGVRIARTTSSRPVRCARGRDIQALVQCAAEYIAAHGTEEAYRSFHEDPRWGHREFYLYSCGCLSSLGREPGQLAAYPPDRSREGVLGTSLHEVSDSVALPTTCGICTESSTFVGSGWVHYYFVNRVTGTNRAQDFAYVVEIDWDGRRAAVGAGIYERDLPGHMPPGAGERVLPGGRPERIRPSGVRALRLRPSGVPGILRGACLCQRFPLAQRIGQRHWAQLRPPERSHSAERNPIGRSRRLSLKRSGDGMSSESSKRSAKRTGTTCRPDYAAGKMVPEVAFVKRVLAQGVPLLVGTAYRHPTETGAP